MAIAKGLLVLLRRMTARNVQIYWGHTARLSAMIVSWRCLRTWGRTGSSWRSGTRELRGLSCLRCMYTATDTQHAWQLAMLSSDLFIYSAGYRSIRLPDVISYPLVGPCNAMSATWGRTGCSWSSGTSELRLVLFPLHVHTATDSMLDNWQCRRVICLSSACYVVFVPRCSYPSLLLGHVMQCLWRFPKLVWILFKLSICAAVCVWLCEHMKLVDCIELVHTVFRS
jgi:hypothetical protein